MPTLNTFDMINQSSIHIIRKKPNFRCTVVKQIPENPDVFFTDLSDELLALDMPFVNWVERTTGMLLTCRSDSSFCRITSHDLLA